MNLRQYDGMVIKTREPEPRGERRFHSLSSLMLEAVRRQTFGDWPVPYIDPDKLARAGFYYLKTKDHVQCAFCSGIVGFWDKGDVPEEEHRKHFPNCPFMTGAVTGNVPATASPETNEGHLYRLLNQFYAFKVANTKPPLPTTYHADSTCLASGGQVAFPHLNTPVSRLRTFAEWPKETGVDAEMLSEAGFFYTGRSDFVQCFHCGGGLFAWRRGDDPHAEHERSYPFCSFVRMKRQEVGGTEHSSTNTATHQRKRTLSNEEAELLLQHPLAKRVLDLGLSPASVREALKLYLETRGVLCKTVTEALELVFDYDERQRQTSTRESVHDGIALPQPEPQEPPHHHEAPAESAMEVETKEHFLPPTPPPEQSGQATASEYAKLQQEVQALRQEVQKEERRLTCRECGQERVAVVFQPCSHLHLCANCARPRDSCITCGSIVRGTLRPIIG